MPQGFCVPASSRYYKLPLRQGLAHKPILIVHLKHIMAYLQALIA